MVTIVSGGYIKISLLRYIHSPGVDITSLQSILFYQYKGYQNQNTSAKHHIIIIISLHVNTHQMEYYAINTHDHRHEKRVVVYRPTWFSKTIWRNLTFPSRLCVLSWESPQRGCPKKLHLDRTLDLSKDMSSSVLDMSWTYHIFALHVSGHWTLVWGH